MNVIDRFRNKNLGIKTNELENKLKKETVMKNEYKQINFSELHKLSLENFGRFNQNIYTEKVVEMFPEIENYNLGIRIVMDHFHYMGEPIEKHYRTIVYNPCDDFKMLGLQDLSIEQWNQLENLPN